MNVPELNADALLGELKRIVAESEGLLRATQESAGEQAGIARERLGEALETAKRTCRRLEERAIEGARAADKTIRDHPYQSIGLAFGVGLLIGVLVQRK